MIRIDQPLSWRKYQCPLRAQSGPSLQCKRFNRRFSPLERQLCGQTDQPQTAAISNLRHVRHRRLVPKPVIRPAPIVMARPRRWPITAFMRRSGTIAALAFRWTPGQPLSTFMRISTNCPPSTGQPHPTNRTWPDAKEEFIDDDRRAEPRKRDPWHAA